MSSTSTSVAKSSVALLGGDRVEAAQQQLAPVGVHDAVGELDGHARPRYVAPRGRIRPRAPDGRATLVACAWTSSIPRPSRRPTTTRCAPRWPARAPTCACRRAASATAPVPARRRLRARRALLPPRAGGGAGSRARFAAKLAQHVPDMLAYRRAAARGRRRALPVADGAAASTSTCCRATRPRRADRPRRPAARAAPRPARRPAAAVRARRRGRRALRARPRAARRRARASTPREGPRHPARRVRRTSRDVPGERAAARRAGRGRQAGRPVLRPAAPLQGHRRAARRVARASSSTPSCGSSACRAWTSRRCAPPRRRACAGSRASSPTTRSPRYFRRADLVVLPYREIDQSGVLFTALAFGAPLLLSAVGGFREVAAHGAAALVAPGDAAALARRAARACSTTPARARGASPRARAPRRGRALLVGRDRARHLALYDAAESSSSVDADDRGEPSSLAPASSALVAEARRACALVARSAEHTDAAAEPIAAASAGALGPSPGEAAAPAGDVTVHESRTCRRRRSSRRSAACAVGRRQLVGGEALVADEHAQSTVDGGTRRCRRSRRPSRSVRRVSDCQRRYVRVLSLVVVEPSVAAPSRYVPRISSRSSSAAGGMPPSCASAADCAAFTSTAGVGGAGPTPRRRRRRDADQQATSATASTPAPRPPGERRRPARNVARPAPVSDWAARSRARRLQCRRIALDEVRRKSSSGRAGAMGARPRADSELVGATLRSIEELGQRARARRVRAQRCDRRVELVTMRSRRDRDDAAGHAGALLGALPQPASPGPRARDFRKRDPDVLSSRASTRAPADQRASLRPGRSLNCLPMTAIAPDERAAMDNAPALLGCLLAVRRAARLRAGRLPAAARRARPRCGARAPRAPAPRRRAADRQPDRRRLRRGRGDRREGRQRARARLPARAPARSSSPATARPTARCSRRAAPAPTSCSTSPRGGKIRAQDAAVARVARASSSPSRTPTRRGSPTRCATLVARVRRPDGRLRLRPGALRQRRRHEPGGPVLALRDGAARARVAAAARSPPATARSTRRAARPTSRSTRSWATTCRFRSTWSSAAGARSTCPQARATEKMVPSIEGEFARKRRMMSHAWPIVLRGGLLSPRGYPPLYALMIVSHRVLRYARAVPARRRARRERRARRASTRSTPSRSRCSSRCSLAALLGRASSRCARCSSRATTS